jgi:hypothetical protein
MSKVNWQEAARLALDEGWSNYKIADHFAVNESTIRRGLKEHGVQRYLLPVDQDFTARFDIKLDTPMNVTQNKVAIAADWHIPLYDSWYANEFIQESRNRGIKDLILAGDFFNFDALSAYDPKQHEAGLENELVEATAVMGVLMETFDRIYYLWGNHDARMHKALGFAIQFREAMRMVFGSLGEELLYKIQFSNLDHMWVTQGDIPWYICHPQNYTRIPLSTARAIASKVNANVITAHSHHCAVGYAVNGEYIVAEAGGLFDRHKTAYLQRSTTFPTWNQGYVFLESNQLTVRSNGWSV